MSSLCPVPYLHPIDRPVPLKFVHFEMIGVNPVALGFRDIFFTGGEPFILNDIYDMLAYSSARVKTTVLTNAMLLRNARLDKLCRIANDRLIVQVSLDGGRPEDHDAPLRARGGRAVVSDNLQPDVGAGRPRRGCESARRSR